jgi:hypothetical protein
MKKKVTSLNLITQAYHNPKFSGKHVIVIGGKIYATKTGRASSELLEKLSKKYPKETPLITYIPIEDSLIL